jgi:hypothetical protein
MERQGSASFDARDDRLALLLAKGSTRASAAKELGMGLRTVYTKLSDPAFKQLVNETRGRMLDEAFGQLVEAGSGAIAVLKAVMGDTAQPGSTRLRAACEIIDSMLKVGTFAELNERITELEKRLVEQPTLEN